MRCLASSRFKYRLSVVFSLVACVVFAGSTVAEASPSVAPSAPQKAAPSAPPKAAPARPAERPLPVVSRARPLRLAPHRRLVSGAQDALKPAPAPAPEPWSRARSRSRWFHWSYLLDWSVAVAMGGAAMGIESAAPVSRSFRVNDPGIAKPMRSETVPAPYLALTFAIPLATAGIAQIWTRSGHDMHHAALGLAETFGLTLLVTASLKAGVGRLRPDFLARCQPDAGGKCQGDADEITEGRRSFPSGHSSISFAGGTFMALYLWGKLGPIRGPGEFWKVPLILAPLAGSGLIAASRLVDNRHH